MEWRTAEEYSAYKFNTVKGCKWPLDMGVGSEGAKRRCRKGQCLTIQNNRLLNYNKYNIMYIK